MSRSHKSSLYLLWIVTMAASTILGALHVKAQVKPKITSVSISPDNIQAGQSATLTVQLDKPAPSGGFVVGISHITNTGVDDTIVNMPQSLSFQQGASSFPFAINTRRATNGQTDILFVAFNFDDKKSARLIVK